MEINQAIKIVEDNFRINNTDKIKLLGMLQELHQYRSNPLLTVQAVAERQISVSQEEMKYIQRLEQTAQAVIRIYNDYRPPGYSKMNRTLNDLAMALQEGYE